MNIPLTLERETIDDLISERKWTSLAQLNINVVSDSEGDMDCGHYVLHQWGFPANDAIINALLGLRGAPAARDGLILYRTLSRGGSGMHTVHFGFMRNGRVRSKWGREGPVLEHAPELVPTNYGSYAEICAEKTAKQILHDTRQIDMFGPSYY